MKTFIILSLFIMMLGAVSLSASHPSFRWYKIKYQCEMEKQYGGGFQTYLTTIRVKKNQGQAQAEKLAVKEGLNRGCKKNSVAIISSQEEK